MERDGPVKIALSIASREYGAASEAGTYRAVQLAVETLNEDPTYQPELELEVFDDEGDIDQTKKFAREIVDDESVLGVVGPMGSSEALANAPMFAEAGLAQVSPCASHPDLCFEGNETFFRLNPSAVMHARKLVALAEDYFGADSISLLQDDTDWADELTKQISSAISDRALTVNHTVRFPQNQERFDEGEIGEQIEDVVEADNDLLFFVMSPTPGEPITNALRSRGVSVPFVSMNAHVPILPGGSEELPVYQTEAGADWNHLDSAKDLRERYCERYEPDPHYTPEAYDAVQLLAAGIASDENPTRDSVRSYLRSVSNFQGASGEITFDSTGERVDPDVNLYRIYAENGGRRLDHLGQVDSLIDG